MKVKLLIARASASGAQNVGDEVDVSAEEGKRMIEAKQAMPVRATAPQKAVKRAKAEKAVK